MQTLTLEKSLIYESVCNKLIQNNEIQFVGLVNNKGRMISCQINEQFSKFEDNEKEVFFMETALEFSMKNEFNTRFGMVEYVISKRNSANIICLPINEYVLIIITKINVDPQKILEKYFPIIKKDLEDGIN